ncbi:unnamed protein product [Pedinophyceae sp. YPF-701]|nr:unnamed protein product [Pedinophyceae sp. YPF-701]
MREVMVSRFLALLGILCLIQCPLTATFELFDVGGPPQRGPQGAQGHQEARPGDSAARGAEQGGGGKESGAPPRRPPPSGMSAAINQQRNKLLAMASVSHWPGGEDSGKVVRHPDGRIEYVIWSAAPGQQLPQGGLPAGPLQPVQPRPKEQKPSAKPEPVPEPEPQPRQPEPSPPKTGFHDFGDLAGPIRLSNTRGAQEGAGARPQTAGAANGAAAASDAADDGPLPTSKLGSVRLAILLPGSRGTVHLAQQSEILPLITSGAQWGMHVEPMYSGEDVPLAQARNRLLARAMASEGAFTHFLFVDPHVRFAARDVARMVLHNRDVLCGVYPRRSVDWARVVEHARRDAAASVEQVVARGLAYPVRVEGEKGTGRVNVVRGLTPCAECGAGFLMVKRHAVATMQRELPHLRVEGRGGGDEVYRLFDAEPDGEEEVVDGSTFVRRYVALGGRVFADLEVKLRSAAEVDLPGWPLEGVIDVGAGALREDHDS